VNSDIKSKIVRSFLVCTLLFSIIWGGHWALCDQHAQLGTIKFFFLLAISQIVLFPLCAVIIVVAGILLVVVVIILFPIGVLLWWLFKLIAYLVNCYVEFRMRRKLEEMRKGDERARIKLQETNDMLAAEKDQSISEIKNLKAALDCDRRQAVKEKERAENERIRLEELEKKQDIIRNSCKKIILANEASLNDIEEEIVAVQHCGDPSFEEETVKLNYRKQGISQDISQLQETLASLA
jgi:cell division protein FtsB